MQILKIRQDKRRPKFAVVELDNNENYKVYKSVIKKYGLRKGDELNENKLNELLQWDEFYRAKDVALKYFSYRQRSEYEIQAKLTKSKFKPYIIKKVIDNLKSVGLINDLEFAECFAKNALNKRLISKNLMKKKLLEKGISKEIINNVLQKYFSNLDENAIVRKLAIKQLKKYQKLKPKSTDKEHFIRLAAFLTRRGFSWDVISRVCRGMLNINSVDEI
ncbi:MAG: Regulatory protein recX [Ignavibacteriae bacterium]|nr:MAG: Regulatory protein recX [Ignavibacteriota bacterium]